MKVSAIVVAAGSGTRMKSNVKKPYLEIEGIPLLIRTLRGLRQSRFIQGIVLVVSEEELNDVKKMISKYNIQGVTHVIAGGSERQESVYNGMKALDETVAIVVVHDGVRPFVTADQLDRVVQAAVDYGAATIGTPVKDTIKKVQDGMVVATLPRQELYAVQTPQAFRTDLIWNAHVKARNSEYQGTDDASLVEWAGHPVKIVEGSYRNIKITTPEDLLIAKAFLQRRENHD